MGSPGNTEAAQLVAREIPSRVNIEDTADKNAIAPLELVGRRLTKESGLTFVGNFLLKGVTITSSIILARILGVEALGIWAIVTATGGLAWILAEMGLGNAAVRVIAEKNRNPPLRASAEATAVYLSLFVGVPTILVFLALSPLLATELYGIPEVAILFVLVSLASLLRIGQNIFAAILQARRRISLLAIWSLVLGTVNSVALVGGAMVLGLVGAFLAGVGSALGSLLIFLVLVRKGNHRWPWSAFSAATSRRLLSLGLPGMVLNLIAAMGAWLSLTFLSIRGSYEDVGLYNVAWRAASFLAFPTAAIFVALFPLASESFATNRDLFHRMFNETSRYALVVAVPLSFAFILVAPEIIGVLYGNEFLPAAPFLSVLVAAGFLAAMAPWGSILFYMNESMLSAVQVYSIAVMSQILTAALLIPTFGIAGVVAATIAYSFSVTIATPLLTAHGELRRLVATPYSWAVIAATGLLLLGMVVATLALVLRITLLIATFAAYYWGLQRFVLKSRDRRFIRGMLVSIVRRLKSG